MPPLPHRRDFLRLGSLAFGGLSLPSLIAQSSSRERACIVIFQNGGASQLDFFDPKPDAPHDIRGSFGSVPTPVPGVHFSGLLPRTAQAFPRFAVIRSMHSDEAIHERARQYIFSGTKPRNDLLHPSYGAVLSKERGSRHGLPAFVSIPDKDLSAEAGFLGPAHDPFLTGDPNAKNFTVRDLTLPAGISDAESHARRQILARMDAEFARLTQSPLLDDIDAFSAKALDLIASPAARLAFDIHREPDSLRDAYGRTGLGQGCLLARRLIEAGARLATVFHGGYDTHREHEKGARKLNAEFDQAFPTLLADLQQRGLLENTLIAVIGDFGRTPKLNFSGGRDHWPRAFSVALAGAGIRGGTIIGATDAHAAEPTQRPVSIEDLGATIYHALGINAQKEYQTNGRPVRINKDGKPVLELFG
jgi:hypothetical protein